MNKDEVKFVSTRDGIDNDRREQYKNLAPDKWKEIVKSVIYGMLVMTDPCKWASSWVEIYQNLIKQNELVSFPIPLEDIEMMYQTSKEAHVFRRPSINRIPSRPLHP